MIALVCPILLFFMSFMVKPLNYYISLIFQSSILWQQSDAPSFRYTTDIINKKYNHSFSMRLLNGYCISIFIKIIKKEIYDFINSKLGYAKLKVNYSLKRKYFLVINLLVFILLYYNLKIFLHCQ